MTKNTRKPDFFIVGAPKSGTTSLNHYLSLHPDIFMPLRKEMHYFGSDLTKIPHEFFVLKEKEYLKQFSPAQKEKHLGEASVMYLYSSSAAREIYEFNPKSKIIIMLRNPVETLYSYHSQLLWGGYEDIEDFKQALDAEPDRKAGRRIPRCAMMPNSLYYSEIARYSEQIKRYFEVFERKNIHIIIYDDFKKDTHKELVKVLEFLGVSTNIEIKLSVKNSNKKVVSRRLQELIQRPPSLYRCTLGLLPDKIRMIILYKLVGLNTRYQRREPLNTDLTNRLCSLFENEIKDLGKILNRDLSHWVTEKIA